MRRSTATWRRAASGYGAGDTVKAGEPIGSVGLSGNTEYPHLHMTVRQRGQLVDPFAFEAPPGACGAGKSLWAAPLKPLLAYKPSVVLNTGFAAGPVTMEAIEMAEPARTRWLRRRLRSSPSSGQSA